MRKAKIDKYTKEIELSKKDKAQIDKKLDQFLKGKKCLICKSKKIFMDGLPLEIRTSKKITTNIYHRNLYVCKCCENCGHSQFFDLNYLI